MSAKKRGGGKQSGATFPLSWRISILPEEKKKTKDVRSGGKGGGGVEGEVRHSKQNWEGEDVLLSHAKKERRIKSVLSYSFLNEEERLNISSVLLGEREEGRRSAPAAH